MTCVDSSRDLGLFLFLVIPALSRDPAAFSAEHGRFGG
jgi:hypothetical protein